MTDVFGNHAFVKPAGSGQDDDWQRWAMFNLNKKGEDPVPGDTRLFIPPVVINRMESEPLERVVFLKDEMANMVWAIEEIVPDGINGGMEGKLAELTLHNYFIKTNKYPPTSNSIEPNDAAMVYKIMNALPENWIPFIPVKLSGNRAIQYRRATFKRVVNNVGTSVSISPRTYILSPHGTDAYYINEEEILKSGTIVATTYQRTRWYNGEVITWLGRNRTTGKGPGRSGLKFDKMKSKE